MKALATGDPRILEKAKLDAEVTRLERLERSHTRNQRTLSGTIDKAERQLPTLEAAIAQIDQAIGQRIDTTGDRLSMVVGANRWSARADAAIALRNALAAIGGNNPDTTQFAAWDRPNHVGNLGGFDVIATPRRFLEPHLSLELAGIPRSAIQVAYDELRADRPLGIVIQLENRVRGLERTRDKITDEASNLSREADRARDDYGRPFTRRDALDAARARSTALAAELAEQDKQRQQPATDQATPPDRSGPAADAVPAVPSEHPSPAPTVPASASPISGPPTGSTDSAVRDWAAQPPRSPAEHQQMAKDTAAATFAARPPVASMDRPSVERELRHVHGDTSYYSTAHAARDALAAARAAIPAQQSTLAPSAPATTETAPMASDVHPRHQIQATYSGQQVYVTYSVDINLKMRIELQSEPVGLRARDADRVLRRISQDPTLTDITVDGQPYSTTAKPAADAPSRPAVAAEDRWSNACRAIDPRVLDDPHWPALARSLDRFAAGGHDVEQLLREVTSRRSLPDGNPARNLDYRLADAAPDVAASSPAQPWSAAPNGPSPNEPSAPSIAPQQRRTGPAR